MPIRKIKAGLVLTKDVDTFVGEPGYLFYDESSSGDKTLRISDGVTPGGISFLTAGDSSVSGISQSTLRVAGDDSSAIELDLSGTGETFKIAGTGGITTTVSGDTITIDGSGVAGSGSLTISDDSSTTATITNGQDTLKFAGGTNITTAI